MCGRYRLYRCKQIIAEHFGAIPDDQDWSPRYNIAPTQIRQTANSTRELSLRRWGLIPPRRDERNRGTHKLSFFAANTSTPHRNQV
jgi:putative SOS response-associated peptidase YedK